MDNVSSPAIFAFDALYTFNTSDWLRVLVTIVTEAPVYAASAATYRACNEGSQ